MARRTADDWIEAAGAAIAKSGIAAVAVEPLARALGVTKGSFYWHFPNRDALLKAVLERWEREGTEAQIASAERVADPRQRIERLIDAGFADPDHRGPAIHLALLDASGHPLVEPVLRRVDERRTNYALASYRALGLDARTARLWAIQTYATYLGTLQLRRDLPAWAPRGPLDAAYRRHLIATLIPNPVEES